MVCPICGIEKENPFRHACSSCKEARKCEYCGEGYKNINIGKLLGEGDKWGCNECADKLLTKKICVNAGEGE